MNKANKLEYINLSDNFVVSTMSDSADYVDVKIAVTIFVLVSLFFAFIYYLILPHSSMNLRLELSHLATLAIVCTIILMSGILMYSYKQSARGFMRVIECNKDAVILGRRRQSNNVEIVYWQDLLAVEVSEENDLSGNSVKVLYLQDSKVVYKLKWQDAFCWMDSDDFFAEVRSNAPNAKIAFNISEAQQDPFDSRYTNLWLEYFSNPQERERKDDLPDGTVLNEGKYKVVERLGGGGQGKVYLAECLKGEPTSGKVVLKEYILPVHREAMLEEQEKSLLSDEAEILARIDHAQIVSLFDCFVEDHRGYLVLEYVEGKSLEEMVAKNGPADQKTACKMMIEACSTLSYLHQLNPPIIHRDISPDNFIYQLDGSIKLVDFTVALQSESKRTATIVGKQSYIAPDQFRGAPTNQSDIYSLGCSMFFLLTGQHPEPLEPGNPQSINSKIRDDVAKVVQKATAFDPRQRYADANQMKTDIEKLFA